MRERRDIILVTGRNMVGKTTALYHLQAYIHPNSTERNVITDSQCLLEAMKKDDEQGGLHHTHDWCVNDRGHDHGPGNNPIFPFTVMDNEIPDATFKHFFAILNDLPHDNKMYFAEFAGGVNVLSESDPAHVVDYSYKKIKRMLDSNRYMYQSLLRRIHAVIHLTASDDIRKSLKERRLMFYSPRLAKSTASWLIDDRVLQFYGYDDFSEIEGLFSEFSIRVWNVTNDGTQRFFDELHDLIKDDFLGL